MKQAVLFFTWIVFAMPLMSQEFSFTLYLEDAAGNKDQVVLGYDAEATMGIDPQFGEEDLIDTAFERDFEVRVGNLFDSYFPKSLSKKQISPKSCGTDFYYVYFQHVFVRCKNYPITISWDADFNDECIDHSFLTDWDSGGWFDAVHGWEQGPFFLKETGSVVLPYLNKALGSRLYNGVELNYFYVAISSKEDFKKVVSLDKVSVENPIKVYPNPMEEKMKLASLFPMEKITLFDLNSRIVREISCNGELEYTLSRRSIPAGVYLLKITRKDGKIDVKRLMVK